MCVVCSATSTYNYACVTGEGDAAILPATVASTYNTYGKSSFGWDAAGAQITRANAKWDDAVAGNALGSAGALTWSFATTPTSGYQQVDTAMMAFVHRAIDYIDDVARVAFTRVGTGTTGPSAFSDSANIRIQNDADYGGGWASWGYTYGSGGQPHRITSATVTIGGTAGYTQDDDYGMTVTLHEIMHALGLSHPGDYNGSGATTYESQAVYFEDSRQYSVMSYWSETKTGADHFEWVWNAATSSWVAVGGYATNLLLHDIAAMHRLYGANMNTRTGDTIYGFGSNTGDSGWTLVDQYDSIIAALWDAGGIDTLNLSGFSTASDIDLREEAFSSFGRLKLNFSIAKGVVLENVVLGAGDDVVLGNAANNTVTGNDGADTIDGAGGNDRLLGGNGADKLYGNVGDDWLDGGAGIDWLFGGDGNDVIVYDAADDWAGGNVQGGSGWDTLLFNLVRTAVDLAAYGFELAALRLVDTAAQLWSELTEYYSVDNRHTQTTTYWDNGTSTIVVYDAYAENPWSEWHRTYAANGSLTSEHYVMDPSTPTAVADTATVVEDSGVAATGNLLGNDTGGSLAVRTVGSTTVAASGNTTVAGTYGVLTISASGAFSYALNNANAEVNALNLGQTLTETFTYVAGNAHGTSASTLRVTISGRTDPAVGTGTSGNDTLNGTTGAETITGLGGNDTIDGRGGGDSIDGGIGNDRIHYHASDDPAKVKGGAGSDTLVISGAANPTGYNLVAGGFEFAERTVTDTTGAAWTSKTLRYDSAWKLLSEATVNDNGLNVFAEYANGRIVRSTTTDTQNTMAYATSTSEYDSAGKLVSKLVVNDDGTRSQTTYVAGALSRNVTTDPLNKHAWSNTTTDYAGGKIASKLQVNDDTTRVQSTYVDGVLTGVVTTDPLDRKVWTSITDDYAGGVKVRSTTVNDDGTIVVGSYTGGKLVSQVTTDPLDAKTYTSITDTFVAGKLVTKLQVNDDGTETTTTYSGSAMTSMVTVDCDDAHAYDRMETLYSAGRMSQRTVINDNGVNTVTTYASTGVMTKRVTTDTQNVVTYSSITEQYDLSGALVLRTQVNDNGTQSITGGAASNTLKGGVFNDALTGGGGSDFFVFAPGGASDTVLDFADGIDRLDFRAYGVDTIAELRAIATVSETSVGVLVDLAGPDMVTIRNFTLAQFGAGDFVIG